MIALRYVLSSFMTETLTFYNDYNMGGITITRSTFEARYKKRTWETINMRACTLGRDRAPIVTWPVTTRI